MPGSLSSCPQFLVSGLNLSFAPFYFGTVPRAASVICITRLCDESGQGARIGAGAYRFYFPGEVGWARVNEGWEGFRFRPARRERRVPLCDQSGTHPSQKAREGWGTHCMVVLAEGWATRPAMRGCGTPRRVGHPASPLMYHATFGKFLLSRCPHELATASHIVRRHSCHNYLRRGSRLLAYASTSPKTCR